MFRGDWAQGSGGLGVSTPFNGIRGSPKSISESETTTLLGQPKDESRILCKDSCFHSPRQNLCTLDPLPLDPYIPTLKLKSFQDQAFGFTTFNFRCRVCKHDWGGHVAVEGSGFSGSLTVVHYNGLRCTLMYLNILPHYTILQYTTLCYITLYTVLHHNTYQ